MPDTTSINHEQERKGDVRKIVDSTHPKKVVVAGPGTGKSFLFQEVIKKKQQEGKTNFLAVTFIGKLGDSLADDLAGLAETQTLHGFARQFALKHCPGDWEYYPGMLSLVKEDLEIKGIVDFKIGDDNYKERTTHYKAFGHDDVVHYAVQICKKDPQKIPKYDLVLIDEFQDFNEIESEFIDLIATKNEVLIVGDDDQALYEFKGSSPKYIREKFISSNDAFESHTLRFCSRCTEVIVGAFHGVVRHFGFDTTQNGRIKKEYICYTPDKRKDSDLNSKIYLMEDVKVGMIPVRIKDQLESVLETQKIKSVLVVGEGQSCQTILHSVAKKLRAFGFKNVDHNPSSTKMFSFNQEVVDGYKFLSRGKNYALTWRLLVKHSDSGFDWKRSVLDSYSDTATFVASIPEPFKKKCEAGAKTLSKILNKPPSTIKSIADSSMETLISEIVSEKKKDREMLVDQLLGENKNLSRPLANLEITVCTILGSKGLGADVVFLVGFDQGKLPAKLLTLLIENRAAKKIRLYFIFR